MGCAHAAPDAGAGRNVGAYPTQRAVAGIRRQLVQVGGRGTRTGQRKIGVPDPLTFGCCCRRRTRSL